MTWMASILSTGKFKGTIKTHFMSHQSKMGSRRKTTLWLNEPILDFRRHKPFVLKHLKIKSDWRTTKDEQTNLTSHWKTWLGLKIGINRRQIPCGCHQCNQTKIIQAFGFSETVTKGFQPLVQRKETKVKPTASQVMKKEKPPISAWN